MKCTLFIFILEYSFPKGNAIYVHRHWNCNTGIIIFASLEMASHYIPASLGSWQCSSLAHLSGPLDHLPQGGRQKSPHEKEIPAQTIALKQPGTLLHADFSHPCFLQLLLYILKPQAVLQAGRTVCRHTGALMYSSYPTIKSLPMFFDRRRALVVS